MQIAIEKYVLHRRLTERDLKESNARLKDAFRQHSEA